MILGSFMEIYSRESKFPENTPKIDFDSNNYGLPQDAFVSLILLNPAVLLGKAANENSRRGGFANPEQFQCLAV
jgi:hypothetical protein